MSPHIVFVKTKLRQFVKTFVKTFSKSLLIWSNGYDFRLPSERLRFNSAYQQFDCLRGRKGEYKELVCFMHHVGSNPTSNTKFYTFRIVSYIEDTYILVMLNNLESCGSLTLAVQFRLSSFKCTHSNI